MTLNGLQQYVKENFAENLDPLSLDYGVARLFTQTGQLGEAMLSDGDVGKEITDVLFVLLALANRSGLDLDHAVATHLTGRDPGEFRTRLPCP